MERKIIVFIAFFICTSTAAALSQTYLLNPENLSVSEKHLKLDAALEREWLNSFYNLLQVSSFGPNSNAENIKEKIHRASQSFVRLENDDALDLVEEGLALISRSWPYDSMKEDISELLSLKLMIRSADEQEARDVEKSLQFLPFTREESFLAHLPLKLRLQFQKLNPPEVKLEANDFTTPFIRVFIFGNAANFPLLLPTGRYLVHFLRTNGQVEADWMEVRVGKSQPQSTKLWSDSVFKRISHPVLSDALLRSRPAPLRGVSAVAVWVKAADSTSPTKMEFRFASERRASTAILASSRILPNAKQESPNWLNQFDSRMDLRAEENAQANRNQIWKSPWFWVASTALAVGAGFLIYQATQDESTTVKTP